VLWVADDWWQYRLQFDVDNSTILDKEILDLVFEGLDTIAKVTLNDAVIGTADNFHRTWVFPVKKHLRPKNNTLVVTFESAVIYSKSKHKEWANVTLPEVFAHIRKPHFHFGWDWAAQLTTCGIFKPVYLRGYSYARIFSS
jgi:beta-mannosidase